MGCKCCAGGVLWAAGSTLWVQAAPGHRHPACSTSFSSWGHLAPNAIPAFKICSVASLLSVWEPQARCQCACGYKKQCPHASLTRKQPLGSCPHNHIAAQSACRTPPFPTATAELPEPAASEGLAPRGLGIPSFSSMSHPP